TKNTPAPPLQPPVTPPAQLPVTPPAPPFSANPNGPPPPPPSLPPLLSLKPPSSQSQTEKIKSKFEDLIMQATKLVDAINEFKEGKTVKCNSIRECAAATLNKLQKPWKVVNQKQYMQDVCTPSEFQKILSEMKWKWQAPESIAI